MKPQLSFGTLEIPVADKGPEAGVPSIFNSQTVQNKITFFLDETDEIFEAYGQVPNVYPYREYNCYSRRTELRSIKTAVLENDALRAEFIPEFGGRLWRLIDKRSGENLIYTNDVIRPSNISERNAWFSGGVEWNIGVIGHTPLTMEPLFVAELEHQGMPILRMYEYERIRAVVYQMDFWLEEAGSVLNCRMRIANETAKVLPMYWWSNIAVPEYEDGRVLAPGKDAYSYRKGGVRKVPLPYVDGVEVTHYKDIEMAVDYFFNIPEDACKFIANLRPDGYGLLHTSTRRLQSRKLFSWGSVDGSNRWQEFLTNDAGRYIEIQAGLAKTQYGCLPMPPHSAWEWVEQYGAIHAPAELVSLPFEHASARMEALARERCRAESPECAAARAREWTRTRGRVVYRGSGYGALCNRFRKAEGEPPMSPHLDFESPDKRQQGFLQYLESGIFPQPAPDAAPEDFLDGDTWYELLNKSVLGDAADNWYARYHLGVLHLLRGKLKKARQELKISIKLRESAWAYHALAVAELRVGDKRACSQAMRAGIKLRGGDLGYLKKAFQILLSAEDYAGVLSAFSALSPELAADPRLLLGKIEALCHTGARDKAFALLTDNGGLDIDDIGEGDDLINRLWDSLCDPPGTPIPHKLNFKCAPPLEETGEEL